MVNAHVLVEKYKPDPFILLVLLWSGCNSPIHTLQNVFPFAVQPKDPEKNPTFPFFMQFNILAPDEFLFNYSFDGWDVPSGPSDDTMKTDFAVLGFNGGIWCPGSGSNDRINNVCMGVTCCSPCIHAEMEHWDLGQKPLKSIHLIT